MLFFARLRAMCILGIHTPPSRQVSRLSALSVLGIIFFFCLILQVVYFGFVRRNDDRNIAQI